MLVSQEGMVSDCFGGKEGRGSLPSLKGYKVAGDLAQPLWHPIVCIVSGDEGI